MQGMGASRGAKEGEQAKSLGYRNEGWKGFGWISSVGKREKGGSSGDFPHSASRGGPL